MINYSQRCLLCGSYGYQDPSWLWGVVQVGYAFVQGNNVPVFKSSEEQVSLFKCSVCDKEYALVE